MVRRYASTPAERVAVVSPLLAQAGRYRLVTGLSRRLGVARQTLYTWKALGRAVLERAFAPSTAASVTPSLERAVLTLWGEGHASERGMPRCLAAVGQPTVSLGTIAGVLAEAERRALRWCAQHPVPADRRALALDELYGTQRRGRT
ncbi:MAG: hypothetical protein HY690_05005 [Chloroflexi bacterium]|nr:hypothetical protein [Chloroflexota bacterium]